jgi:hypothetical protein
LDKKISARVDVYQDIYWVVPEQEPATVIAELKQENLEL